MADITGKPVSFWIDSTPNTNFTQFIDNVVVDVAIVGGGIAGLTAAILLKRAGKTVAVIEANHIAAGVSGHTTAKVTSLHRTIYADLIKEIGLEKARIYGESNQAAVEFVATMVAQEQIDCDFSREKAYTFARHQDDLSQIEAEVEAAVKLGLPATFAQETSLPFPIAGAVQFENQAKFHPRKYLLHLANQIQGGGSYIFEETRVKTAEEGTPCQVTTNKGVVNATDVIVTTNLPILDRGLFFAKTYPKRSYIVGAHIDPAKAPEGVFIGVGNDTHSLRTTPTQDGGMLLMIGGIGHKTGDTVNTEKYYLDLENYGLSNFGIETFDYRWSSQDMISFDNIPYIGKLTPANEHIYVATGFSLWGMSNGTMSGMLLSDLIQGKQNPWSELYDATRATPFLSATSIKENADVAKHWVADRLKGLQDSSVSEVGAGEGKLLSIDGEKIGAYRDDSGTLHAVSAVCPHLGCIVEWNSAEKSWDCPCHGARFNCEGEVLRAPAVNNLEKKRF
ncbi:MAG: FAD-dependent oxidoreductase [Cyanobacteriota bacterium]|nr:FAD-dependent oxidoreductase [Cyanobacteriota bacterium]